MGFHLTDLDLGEFHFEDPYGTVMAKAEEDHFNLQKHFKHPPSLDVLNGRLEFPENLSGLFDNRIVTLVDPYAFYWSGPSLPALWSQWKVRFRYLTVGYEETHKKDTLVDRITFGLTDLRYIFADDGTHGIMSAKGGKTLVSPWDDGFNLDEIVGVTMKTEVFRAHTALGTIVGNQGPVTVDAFTHRNEQSVEINFESPITVPEAIRQAISVSRFFAALVGRSQNIEWIHVHTTTLDEHKRPHKVILGRRSVEVFDTSEYGELNPFDSLIHSISRRNELESVLTKWVDLEFRDERRAESRRVAHSNYGKASSRERLYGAMQIPEWVIPDTHGRRKLAHNKDTDRINLVRAKCPNLDSDDLPKMVRLARRLRNFHSHAEDGEGKGMSSGDAKELQRIGGNVFLAQIVETVNGLADLFDCGYNIQMLQPVSRHPFRQCIRNFERYVRAVSKARLMNA